MNPNSRNKTLNYTCTSHSADETRRIGQRTGDCFDTGMVVGLIGDLGSGKTVFVQGLAKGLAVPPDHYITSPTYTLINEYPGRCPLYHVDLYRIAHSEEVHDLGLLDLLYADGVVVVEWADRLPKELLSDYLEIRLEILDDTTRRLSLSSYGHNPANLLSKLIEILISAHP